MGKKSKTSKSYVITNGPITQKQADSLKKDMTAPSKIDPKNPLPFDVNALDLTFGGDMARLMLPHDQIPKDYVGKEPFVRLQQEWFFTGLGEDTLARLEAKPGIDFDKALRHLAAIQRSFAPKHEHKQDCVAYLFSCWFDLEAA